MQLSVVSCTNVVRAIPRPATPPVPSDRERFCHATVSCVTRPRVGFDPLGQLPQPFRTPVPSDNRGLCHATVSCVMHECSQGDSSSGNTASSVGQGEVLSCNCQLCHASQTEPTKNQEPTTPQLPIPRSLALRLILPESTSTASILPDLNCGSSDA
jgi:hypothetical protein